MAEPVSIAITTTLLPILLAGIQSGLALALDAMPEIHYQRNKHAMKKLHALFLKAKKGELTEKDFHQAQDYYTKIETFALLSENKMLLDHLEQILNLMECTLVVKNLMEKNHPIDSPDIDILSTKIQTWDMGDAMVDIFKKHDLPPYEAISSSPGLIRDPVLEASGGNSANGKAWRRRAMWCLVAVMPPLLLVPKIRQRC